MIIFQNNYSDPNGLDFRELMKYIYMNVDHRKRNQQISLNSLNMIPSPGIDKNA